MYLTNPDLVAMQLYTMCVNNNTYSVSNQYIKYLK